MLLEQRMDELREHFGLTPEDLNIDLGPCSGRCCRGTGPEPDRPCAGSAAGDVDPVVIDDRAASARRWSSELPRVCSIAVNLLT